MRRFLPSLLLLITSLLLVFRLTAQPLSRQAVVVLTTDQERVSLQGSLAYFRDSTRNKTIQDVSRLDSSAAFQPVKSPVPNFGVITGTERATPIWLRFRVQNSTQRLQAWLTEIDFWCFDELQLFIVDTQNRVLFVSPVMGWKTPVAQRIRHHRHFWFPFTLLGKENATAYVRVLKYRGSQIVPIKLVRESAYDATTQMGYLGWGGVLLTLTFVALMSLIFYLITLDRVYSKYVFCLLGLVGFFVINDGFLNQFGFNAQFWMPRQNVYFLFPLILFYSQLTFVRTFLSLRYTPSHRWHKVGTAVLWAGILCLLALTAEWFVPLTPLLEQIFIRLFTLLYWLPLPIIVGYIFISIIHRYHVPEAWLYAIAVLPFYALNLGLVFANFGLLPTFQPLANFAYYAPTALFEVLVLTVGLAYRYKANRDQTERLIKASTVQQQRTYEAEVQALELKNTLLLEKERIARDLHDNVGAHLSFVVTNLTHISDQAEKQSIPDGKQWASRLRNIVMHTREAVKLLRETIWAIHQESFTLEEFAERLNQYINRYFHDTDGLQVHVQVTGSQTQRLSSTQVLNLFRIVQEALNNVVKHAQATTANVHLQVRSSGNISLRIHDNGQGFAWADGHALDQHYGLQNMQIRAQELGGSFRVFADQGTTIEVEV